MACNRRALLKRIHDETVQSTSMSRKILFALLAGASTLAVNLQPAAAIEATQPTVVYADQMPQRPAPVRMASAERPGMGGGGFLDFLFSDGQSGRRFQPQPGYDPRRPLLPPMDPQQSMRQDASEPARPAFDPRYEKQMVEYNGREGVG